MGAVDIRIKEFFKINSVFAQLFSGGVFSGRLSIDPARLQELDTVSQETIRLADGQLKDVERLRDVQKIAMLFDGKMAFQLIMGVEGQDGVNYFMPVRCMELDALTYSYQCRRISAEAKEKKEIRKYADGVPKGTRIVPTVTLVFYFGEEVWDGPTSVYDMLDIPEELKDWAKTIIPDYQMHIIDARHMAAEQIDAFEGDLKAFLLMLQECYDEEKLKTALAMHRETWYAIGKIKNDNRYIEYIDKVSDKDLEGGIYMDATLDYIEKRGEKRGAGLVVDLYQQLVNDGRLDELNEALKDKDRMIGLLMEYSMLDGGI